MSKNTVIPIVTIAARVRCPKNDDQFVKSANKQDHFRVTFDLDRPTRERLLFVVPIGTDGKEIGGLVVDHAVRTGIGDSYEAALNTFGVAANTALFFRLFTADADGKASIVASSFPKDVRGGASFVVVTQCKTQDRAGEIRAAVANFDPLSSAGDRY